MIQDQTIDEALIEIMRTKKALEALRKVRRKASHGVPALRSPHWQTDRECGKEHAAAKRASMDLTRVLSRLRSSK